MIALCPDSKNCSEDLLEPDLLKGSAELTIEGTVTTCQWTATRSGTGAMWDVHMSMGDTSEETAKAIFAELSSCRLH